MRRPRGHSENRGITLLELMVVITLVGLSLFLIRGAFRAVTKADLVENSTELATLMKRTSQLAIEHGEMHRVVFDIEKGVYTVEKCQGAAAILRNEALRPDEEKTKQAVERGKQRLSQMPDDALAAGDPDEAMKKVTAMSGHHVADRTCMPAEDAITGDAKGKGWMRTLRTDRDIKFKQIWVQHMEGGATKGQVAIYFFPNGSAEKAVVEVVDGNDTFSVLVHGLTGRVELRDGKLKDVDDHMMRNVMGDRDAKREDER
jgi:type II secretory pathway pseudopilin PulG